MNQPTNQDRFSPPWLLILGLLLGGSLLVFMAWDSISASFRKSQSASPHVVKLTDENWQKEVVESTIPVMVDFWGPGCPPCEKLAPIISKLATQYQGKIKVGKLNVSQSDKIAAKFAIHNIPTVIFFKGDEPITAFEGYRAEAEVVKVIESVLAKK